MIVWVYDRWGNQVDCLGDFIEFAHDDEIGALDYIEFTVEGNPLEKGDNLVWRDDFAVWHEHRVSSVDVRHWGGSVYSHVYAENSIADLATTYINERNAYDCSNVVALTTLFNNIDTLWEIGNAYSVGGTNSLKFYHCTGYEGLVQIIELWGGEIDTSITVGTTGVTRRRLNYYAERGSDNGLLFTYGFDADDIVRTVNLDEVVTRLHCFGKGEETLDDTGQGTGNYSRRITFADINGGKDYVEDNAAMEKWGMPSAKGGKRHSEGWYIWEDVTEPKELLELGKKKLKDVSEPRVSYSANVIILANAGMDFKNARSGDRVYIRDEPLDERLNGRVTHVRRYLDGGKPTEITLGNVIRTIGTVLRDQQSVLDSLNRRASTWDSAAWADGSWLEQMIDNLNEAMNVSGGYVYWEEGEGITVFDRRIDQDPTMCIQLKGAGFRIANSKKSNGEWNFRTFGTGDGFTADEIIAGTIRGGANYWNLNSGDLLFKGGSIQSADGTSVWNLTTGKLTTNKMVAHDIEADGTFKCGTASDLLELKEGTIYGSHNGKNLGWINYSGKATENDGSGASYQGLLLYGAEYLGLWAPRVSFGNDYTPGTTARRLWSTLSTTYGITTVSSVYSAGTNGAIYTDTRTYNLRFIHGALISTSIS